MRRSTRNWLPIGQLRVAGFSAIAHPDAQLLEDVAVPGEATRARMQGLRTPPHAATQGLRTPPPRQLLPPPPCRIHYCSRVGFLGSPRSPTPPSGVQVPFPLLLYTFHFFAAQQAVASSSPQSAPPQSARASRLRRVDAPVRIHVQDECEKSSQIGRQSPSWPIGANLAGRVPRGFLGRKTTCQSPLGQCAGLFGRPPCPLPCRQKKKKPGSLRFVPDPRGHGWSRAKKCSRASSIAQTSQNPKDIPVKNS
ncbi:hypothetical protein SORBI_3004G281750 [Sorghum bicolor]|uniref:Uncharacterized protein n=1 Tax=Sorghum bicolor TaxID=4558 RepID=A0A1Z5RQ01_SORBI|nr:hypothetical protein SORBI_3004G281750 [Sorghum bicolor]